MSQRPYKVDDIIINPWPANATQTISKKKQANKMQ